MRAHAVDGDGDAKASGANASISEHSVFNKGDAAFVMIEYGSAGLRVFDLRDGDHPKEVAYYNDGKGYVHSGVFTKMKPAGS